jgi:hypothetical protein
VDSGLISFTYTGAGCSYAVDPPTTRGYTDVALDDAVTSVDAATATPERVRLGLGGSTTAGQPGYPDLTTTAVLSWETSGANHAAKARLGSSATALTDIHTGYAWTTPPPTIGIGNNEAAVNMHEVHVCGLKPATTYYYQVGGGATGHEIWSATQSFTTLPSSGAIKVGVMGDARDTVTTWALVNQRMLMSGVSSILFSGDVIDIGTDESEYSQWLNAIWETGVDGGAEGSPGGFGTLGQLMFLPIAGNHENEAVQFYSNFAIPGDGPYAKAFSSFNVGSAHVIMIDDQPIGTQPGGTETMAQLAWLEQDLAAANADRTNHPFIIAVSHRGLFSTSLHSTDGDVLQTRASLAPLYDKYKVDLVFNGHDHEYERSKPVNAATPPSNPPIVVSGSTHGTTYVICAGAGADPYQVGAGMPPYRAAYTQFGSGTPYIGVYGFLTIDATSLTYAAYGLKGAGGADDMIDTFTLSN